MRYRLSRALALLTQHLLLGRVEVEGREHVGTQGPVLLVACPANASTDVLLLRAALRRRVVFGNTDRPAGGATLARGGLLCVLAGQAGAIDAAARLALDGLPDDGAPQTLQLVVAGLLYSAKGRSRPEACVRFGPPLDVARWRQDHPQGAAAALAEEIRRRVETLTAQFRTRRESLILSWAADVLGTRGEEPPALGRAEASAAEWFRLRQRLQEGYQSLLERCGAEVDQLSARVRRYRMTLLRLGIDPGEVYLPLHPGKAMLFVVRELELLLVGAPLALFGAANHLAPYLLFQLAARTLTLGVVLFAGCCLIQIAASWLFLPPVWAALYTVALPYTGYYALLYHERTGRAFRRARTFLYLLRNRTQREQLVAEGREIIAQIRALAGRLDAKSG